MISELLHPFMAMLMHYSKCLWNCHRRHTAGCTVLCERTRDMQAALCFVADYSMYQGSHLHLPGCIVVEMKHLRGCMKHTANTMTNEVSNHSQLVLGRHSSTCSANSAVWDTRPTHLQPSSVNYRRVTVF